MASSAKRRERPFRVVVPDYKKNRAEWLEARKNYITASDAAAFCGKNPYCSRKQAIKDKVYGRDFRPGERAILGSNLEDGIGLSWVQLRGVKARPCTALLASTLYPWMAATPDLFALVPFAGFGVADLKYSEKIDRDGAVPEYYRIQSEFQMAVVGVTVGWVVNLWGIDFTIGHYEYDQKRIDWIIGETRDAWEAIQKERAKL